MLIIYDESFGINHPIATYSHVCGINFIVYLTVICAHAECTVPTRGVEKASTNYGGPRPEYVAYVLLYTVVSLLSMVQIKPFRPTPSRSATDSQYIRFWVQIFSLSAFAWGQEKIFRRGTNPLSVAIRIRYIYSIKYPNSYMRWRSWLRHCATSRKVASSIPNFVIGFFH